MTEIARVTVISDRAIGLRAAGTLVGQHAGA